MEGEDAVQEGVDGLAGEEGAVWQVRAESVPHDAWIGFREKCEEDTYCLTSPTSPTAAALCSSKLGSDRRYHHSIPHHRSAPYNWTSVDGLRTVGITHN